MVLGMLVDDGIVVVENIYRHLGMGKGRFQAALDGTREVMVPVFTATLTTVAAFAPVLFMPGIMGEFLKYLPLTVGITLSGSLFVAFVFNPVFASLTMTNKEAHRLEGGEKGPGSNDFKDLYRKTSAARAQSSGAACAFLRRVCGLGHFHVRKIRAGRGVFPGDRAGCRVGPDRRPAVAGHRHYRRRHQDSRTHRHVHAGENRFSQDHQHHRRLGKIVPDVSSSQAESNKGYIDIVFKDFEERSVSSYKTMTWLEDTLPQHGSRMESAGHQTGDGPAHRESGRA